MSRRVLAAVTAASLCVVSSQAFSQEVTADTAGGDVTADEATPLPPVVVQAPSEPIVRRNTSKRQAATPSAGGTAVSDEGEGASVAGIEGEGPAIGIFTLGQLDVIGGSTITNEAMWTFNKNNLKSAVEMAPGVTSHSAGGRRNEGDIFVRGFDRFRVPLSIDGVRIYLPADNRLDMNRFLTPDLAELQIQKGYVSVLNGPGGMGGAINMVSRKPTKEFEAEARSGVVMNGDLDDLNQWSSYGYMGTRQKGYYAQVSGTIVDQDHFNLSD
ncbi:MAG TPA: TonB-dependent receptor plug domain-containing protein, partial [Hyphomicrobium sp.]|nr:TonB-dependent receptor plug domain-containing protein [Hyphomicrobium sp.]